MRILVSSFVRRPALLFVWFPTCHANGRIIERARSTSLAAAHRLSNASPPTPEQLSSCTAGAVSVLPTKEGDGTEAYSIHMEVHEHGNEVYQARTGHGLGARTALLVAPSDRHTIRPLSNSPYRDDTCTITDILTFCRVQDWVRFRSAGGRFLRVNERVEWIPGALMVFLATIGTQGPRIEVAIAIER